MSFSSIAYVILWFLTLNFSRSSKIACVRQYFFALRGKSVFFHRLLQSTKKIIMSGRAGGRGGRGGRGGQGGRGAVNLTQAELNAIINDRVTEALAAFQATQPHPHHPLACSFKAFMDCKPHKFSGTEGAVGLLRWFEKAESAFAMCNCPEEDRVKYATGTLEDNDLHWWNGQVDMLGLDGANATPWNEFKDLMREEYCPRDEIQKLENEYYNMKMKGSDIEGFTARSHELAIMCPNMSNPPYKRIELYLNGLAPQIQGMVTAANLGTMQQIIRLAHRLMDQAIKQGTLPQKGSSSSSTATNDNKRKWKNDTDRSNNNKSLS